MSRYRDRGEGLELRAGPKLALAACLAVIGWLAVASAATAAFPGANGRIAFVHDPGTVGTNTDIFTMDQAGHDRMRLTAAAEDDFDPAWSADGERIVFSRYTLGPGSRGADLGDEP